MNQSVATELNIDPARTRGSVTNPLGFLLLSLMLFGIVVDPEAQGGQGGYLSGIFWVLDIAY